MKKTFKPFTTSLIGSLPRSKKIMALKRRLKSDVDFKKEYDELIWLSTTKGRFLLEEDVIPSSDSLKNIEISFDNKQFRIKYYAIVKFGESIKSLLKKLNQEIVHHLQERLTVSPREITVVITGVKSENVSARNMEFKFKYADK